MEERKKFASLCDDILATLDRGGFGLVHRIRHCVEQHKTGRPQNAVTGARRDNVSETTKIKRLRAAEEAEKERACPDLPPPPEPHVAGDEELDELDEELDQVEKDADLYPDA